jgi:hypothetical protein
MKINKKALKLIDKGLSSKTVSKLTESQINVLHSKLLGEQVTEVPNKKTYEVGPKGGEVNGVVISQDPSTKKVMVTTKEGEIDEEEEVTLDPNKDTETQDPHQVGPSSDDGFGDETDGMGMMEEKDGPNPWAICHAQVGPKKTRKFERCVMAVKKQMKEGKNPLSLFLETQIEKIVEKHIPPRITKGDLLKVITESEPAGEPSSPKRKTDSTKKPVSPNLKRYETKEQATAPAPAKPATEPTTRPSTTPKEKPFSPGKNPAPAVKPAPKAGKINPETAKEKVIDLIMNILEK